MKGGWVGAGREWGWRRERGADIRRTAKKNPCLPGKRACCPSRALLRPPSKQPGSLIYAKSSPLACSASDCQVSPSFPSTSHHQTPPYTRTRARAHLLPPREGHVAVLEHVHDLLLHGDEEEHKPVQHQDRPEDGDVKGCKERRAKAQQQRAEACVPAAGTCCGAGSGSQDEGETLQEHPPSPAILPTFPPPHFNPPFPPKQTTHTAPPRASKIRAPSLELWEFAHKRPKLLVRFGGQRGPFEFRVHLGSEEPEQQVQVVDAQSVRHNVKPAQIQQEGGWVQDRRAGPCVAVMVAAVAVRMETLWGPPCCRCQKSCGATTPSKPTLLVCTHGQCTGAGGSPTPATGTARMVCSGPRSPADRGEGWVLGSRSCPV